MSQPIQTLKGFRDFLPEEARQRQWLKNKIVGVFERWGFDPLETPTLEPLELFAGQIGEDEKLFFSFEDNGGRKVALRYDQTVPACRVVGQYAQQLPMPFKRYQIQPAFRAEKPQKGRYREFVQCDADIFGSDSPVADAEVIALGLSIYRELGFKRALVRVNDRQLMKDLPYEAIVAIDKLEKIGREGVLAAMVNKGIPADQAAGYLDQVLNLKPNETIATILEYLKAQGFPEDWYQFDPTIARSFSYSSGPIWEIVIPEIGGGSVLGGERFDGLIEKIAGVKVPGTGFGLGFDRTLEAAQACGLVPVMATGTTALVTVFSAEFIGQSARVSSELRNAGIATEVYPSTAERLGKQLKYANKKGIQWAVVIGPEEVAQGKVGVKNLLAEEANQELLTVAELVALLKS